MKPRSSTSSSKPKKHGYLFKFFIFILIFVIITIAAAVTVQVLERRIDDRNASQYITMYQMQEFYALPENSLDVLILGSSHAMCSYNPYDIEERFGLSAYNLGTALQQPDTGYYLFREVLKTQKPKVLIYDVYFKVMQNSKSRDQAETVLKEMPASWNAFELYWNAFDKDAKLSYFNNRINPYGRLQNILSNWEEYQKPDEVPKNANYHGKGFYLTQSVVQADAMTPEKHPFSEEYVPFHENQVKYLRKIIQLAKENDIEVILVSAPMPPTILSRVSYYDKYHQQIQQIAAQEEVPFYDYGQDLLQDELVLTDQDFADQGHLNTNGSPKFNEFFLDSVSPILSNIE